MQGSSFSHSSSLRHIRRVRLQRGQVVLLFSVQTETDLSTQHTYYAQQSPCNGPVSVRPSVCPSRSPTAAACGGFAAVGPAGRRYRSIAARPAPRGCSTARSYTCGQCHVCSRRTKLVADCEFHFYSSNTQSDNIDSMRQCLTAMRSDLCSCCWLLIEMTRQSAVRARLSSHH